MTVQLPAEIPFPTSPNWLVEKVKETLDAPLNDSLWVIFACLSLLCRYRTPKDAHETVRKLLAGEVDDEMMLERQWFVNLSAKEHEKCLRQFHGMCDVLEHLIHNLTYHDMEGWKDLPEDWQPKVLAHIYQERDELEGFRILFGELPDKVFKEIADMALDSIDGDAKLLPPLGQEFILADPYLTDIMAGRPDAWWGGEDYQE